MYFETKSEKELSRLKKYFFYILINAIILPITNLENINSVLKHIVEHGPNAFKDSFDENVIHKSKFFLLYLLTASFVTQGVLLLDFPHWFYIWYEKRKV